MLTGVFRLGIYKKHKIPFLYRPDQSSFESYQSYFSTSSIFMFMRYNLSNGAWYSNYINDLKVDNYVFLEDDEFKKTNKIFILTEKLSIPFISEYRKNSSKINAIKDYLTITKPTKNDKKSTQTTRSRRQNKPNEY